MLDVSVSAPIGATGFFHEKKYSSRDTVPIKKYRVKSSGQPDPHLQYLNKRSHDQNFSSTPAQAKLVARLFS